MTIFGFRTWRPQADKPENTVMLIKIIVGKGGNVCNQGFLLFVVFSILFKGGYLDFSHLPELKKLYITEIYMKKEYKSSIIKNHKITNKIFFDGVSLKGYVAS